MSYLIRKKKVSYPESIEFQVIDVHEEDVEGLEGDAYAVNLFGVTEEGFSTHVQVNGFMPFFYMKVPKQFQEYQLQPFCEYLQDKYSYKIIDHAEIVKRIDFHGFRNGYQDQFVKFRFKTKKHFSQMRYFLRNLHEQLNFHGLFFWPKTYESKLDPFLSFFHLQDLRTTGWAKVDKFEKCFTSTSQISIQANWKDIVPSEKNGVAPLLQASFDIECIAADGVSFPEWSKPGDKINQIGTTVYIYGKDNSKPLKHIVTLKSCDPIKGAIVESYESERDLLMGWAKFLKQLEPDVLTGYNIYGFDFEYIEERAKRLGIAYVFDKLSRLKEFQSKCIEKELSSSALGNNKMKYFITPGMLHVDLLKVIQRDYKLESYKLDDVASEFIKGKIKEVKRFPSKTKFTVNPGDIRDIEVGNYIGIKMNKLQYYEEDGKQKWKIIKKTKDTLVIDTLIKPPKDVILEWALKKDDLSPKDLFRYQHIDSKHRMIIAKYCLQDNILCNKLLDKLKIVVNNIGMASVCSVPMSYIFLRGQGIKAYSLVAKQCKEDGYLIPDIQPTSDVTFQGATVLSAVPGAHFEPVACNDFSSLYPSSIISHNLSPDTLIVDGRNQDDVETQDIRWNDQDTKGNITNSYCYTFTVPDGVDNHDDEYQRNRVGRGIIPRILIKLLKNRKDVKKQMAKETDPFQKSLLDGLQLSYKLTCNSIYGQMGSSVSPISCMPVAMCTTSIGRSLLQEAAHIVKELYPESTIVYGDSVTGDTKVLIKTSDSLECRVAISALATHWIPYPQFKAGELLRSKQQATVQLQAWTRTGWAKVHRVIRHKCQKRIFLIKTENSEVKVTEDHSLIDEHGNKLKPKECVIGKTKLYQISGTNNVLKSITDLGVTDDFVYDLETEDGSFQAGDGELIVSNTDSIMCKYPSNLPENSAKKDIVQESIDCAMRVEEEASGRMPWPHKLEYEKTYYPYILYSKKRYSGVMYEFDPEHYTKVDNKGIVLKRRDNAKIVKYVYGKALDIILFQQNVEKAQEFVRDCLYKLVDGKFSMDLLVLSKALKKTTTVGWGANGLSLDFSQRAQPPAQAMLARRIADRDPGNAPQLNDRIQYMFYYIPREEQKRKAKQQGRATLRQGDKIETMDFMKQNNLKPDYVHYITNQLMKPLLQLFAIFVKLDDSNMTEEQSQKIREKTVERELFIPVIQHANRLQTGQRSILEFFN